MSRYAQLTIFMGEGNMGAGKWPSAKFHIGDTVKDCDTDKVGVVKAITVYPATEYIFAYWIAGFGHDVEEGRLTLLEAAK